jgi:hypothetical protein
VSSMPPSVVDLIAIVGGLVDVKKRFEAGEINVEQLADNLWAQMQLLAPAHAKVVEETTP